MEDLSDIRSLPLLQLHSTTLRLLSNLLNPTKVLPTEGPIKRHRDWRGLTSLINISTEVEANIWKYDDKTGKVLELWMQSQEATVGELLEHLTTLDRFDVYDDIIASIREQPQQVRPSNQVAIQNNIHNQIATIDDHELITFDDQPGHMHMYHAYVLSAVEDHEFVMKMKRILNAQGFEICTRDNLRPGYASQYPPVSKLISERCLRIILVYSPEFLSSHDNSFFRDYAQALSIEMNVRKLLPIMYRKCELPPHLRIYHMLYVSSDMTSFWDRLIKSLDITKIPSVNSISPPAPQVNSHSSTHSAVNIITMPVSNTHSENDDSRYFLPASAPIRSLTPNNVAHTDDNRYFLTTNAPIRPLTPSNVSDASTISIPQKSASLPLKTPKKPSRIRKFFNIITRKKNKKNLVDTISPVKQLCA